MKKFAPESEQLEKAIVDNGASVTGAEISVTEQYNGGLESKEEELEMGFSALYKLRSSCLSLFLQLSMTLILSAQFSTPTSAVVKVLDA